MIQLYAKGTTDFSKNGISLRPQESTVTFRDNGQWDLDILVPAGNGYTDFDYGQILRCTVPEQHIDQITLGAVSYFTVSNANGTKLYSEMPKTTAVRYSGWTPGRGYTAGDKVTYGTKNYSALHAIAPLTDVAPSVSSDWTQISGTKTDPGKVAATLAYDDTVLKTADFNSEYMEAVTLDGTGGYIKIADCTATGQSGDRTVAARTITVQNFVITEIRKELQGQAIRVTAEHISYQLGRTILGSCSVTGVNPATAILLINGAMKEDYGGEIYTNIDDVTIDGDWSWRNAQNAILDPKAGLLSMTGGHMIRDNLDVFILEDEDEDTKYSVRYGANMKSVTWTGNVSDIVTRVYPIAQTEDGSTLLLPEEYIDTARTIPFIRPEVLDTKLKIGEKVENSDGTEVELTESEVYDRMREAANNRFNIDHCDEAEINLDLDWVHMPETVEYAQYTQLKNAAPGDWVEVADGPLGISEKIRMTGYTWDPMLEKYKGATFGPNREKATVAGYSLQSGSVTARAIGANAVGGSAIQQGSITAREIAANSISADRIAARSITTELIMANAITANEINANAVTAEKIAAGSITTVKLDAQAVTAEKIAADAINADKIAANAISAINAKLGTATITNGMIDNANISYARIMDASVGSLITKDALADTYYIDKLQVRNAQMVYATIGELVIKAANNKYYRLTVDQNGAVTPTEVTPSAAEISAGETSDGHAAIIETDLTVADLSASNMKAINALIDKLTASRIDVGELWARQAFVNQLMVTDISSNTYIQSTIGNWQSGSTITQTINSLDSRISSLGYGTVYMQPEEPSHSELVPGDIWIQTQASGTWEQVYQDYASWQDIYNNVSTWQTLGGVSIMWVWDGRKWQKQLDALDSDTFETEIQQNATNIQLLANRTTTVEGELGNKYTIQSGILIEAAGIKVSGAQYVIIESGGYFQVQTGNFGIDTDSSTYVIWSGASTAANSPFSVKKDGTLKATSGEIGGWALAANSLSSGSGATYVNINSNSSNTYSIWAGAEAATNAPFRLKRDGSVYLTKLIAIGEGGSETTVDLHNYGLWKLNYATVKSVTVSGNTLTITTTAGTTTFSKAAPILTGSWSGGAYTVSVSNYPEVTPNSSGAVNLSFIGQGSGGSSVAKIRAYTSGAIVNDYDVDCPLIYKNGWNEAVSSMYVLGTVYRITSHSGEWVKVQEVGTGYSNPGPI